jgi:hypothetical protein
MLINYVFDGEQREINKKAGVNNRALFTPASQTVQSMYGCA